MIEGQSIQSEELRPSRGIAKIGHKGLFRQGLCIWGKCPSNAFSGPGAVNQHDA
jgi:hypothetical protein